MANLDAELERANAAHDATWNAFDRNSDAVEKIQLQMLVRQTVALERIAAALERIASKTSKKPWRRTTGLGEA